MLNPELTMQCWQIYYDWNIQREDYKEHIDYLLNLDADESERRLKELVVREKLVDRIKEVFSFC